MKMPDKKPIVRTNEKGSVLLITLIVMSAIMILWTTYIYAIIEARRNIQMEGEAKQVERDSGANFTWAMAQLNHALISAKPSQSFVTVKDGVANGWASGRYFKVEGGPFLQGTSTLYEARTFYTGFLATPSVMQQYQLCQHGESFHTHNGFRLIEEQPLAPEALVIQTNNTVSAADYMIIDESAKLNLSSLINEKESLIELDSFGLADSITKRMKDKVPKNARWLSWKHIWNSGVFRSSEDAARKAASLFTTYGWDLDAFQFFNSADDLKGTPVLRMNINDTNLWVGNSKLSPFELAGLTEAGDNLFTLAPVNYNGEIRQDLEQVPNVKWSKQTRSIPAFSHLANHRQRLQTACNLIDFCDKDHTATIGPGKNLSYDTTFCGLEKVPYINHLIFQLDLQPISGSNGLFQVTNLKIDLGLANIYERGHVVTVKLPTTNEIVINGQKVMGGISPKRVICRANSLASLSPQSFANCIGIQPASQFNVELGKFRVELYSTDGHDLLDVSINAKLLPLGKVIASPDKSTYKAAVYFRDCRCNTILSDKNPDGTGNENVVIKSFQPNKSQSEFDPLVVQKEATPRSIHRSGGDLETATSAVDHLSTAYIADGEVKSLWELGAIHRGFPWQTINFSPRNLGSEYSKGDLNLLDQVKLTNAVQSTALKFNPNSATTQIWAAILGSLKIRSNYSTPKVGKAVLNKEDISTSLAKYCLAHSFKGRGEIAEVTKLYSGAKNDRAREEIIGKLAKYMTVRKNLFRLVTSVLLLKKVPSKAVKHGQPTEVVEDCRELTNIQYYKKVSRRKNLYIIYRDAFENHYKILSRTPLTD